ncbi:hypothetical protein D9M71_632750 [compost metagenome]
MAFGAPLGDARRDVHLREVLRVLQVEHHQRQQAAFLAGLEGLFQQLRGLAALGLAQRRLACQQLAQARLGAGRLVHGLAVGLLGFLQLRGVTAGHLHVGQADRGIGVAELRQLAEVLLGGGAVTAFQRFGSEALVGQAGAAGQGHGRGQQQKGGGVMGHGRALLRSLRPARGRPASRRTGRDRR